MFKINQPIIKIEKLFGIIRELIMVKLYFEILSLIPLIFFLPFCLSIRIYHDHMCLHFFPNAVLFSKKGLFYFLSPLTQPQRDLFYIQPSHFGAIGITTWQHFVFQNPTNCHTQNCKGKVTGNSTKMWKDEAFSPSFPSFRDAGFTYIGSQQKGLLFHIVYF